MPGPVLSDDGASSVSRGQPLSPASPHPPLPGGEGPHSALPAAASGFTFSAHPPPPQDEQVSVWGPLGGLALCSPFDLSPSHQSPGCPGLAVSRVPRSLSTSVHPEGDKGSPSPSFSPCTHLASLEPEVFAQALCVRGPLTTAPHSPLDSGLPAAGLEGARLLRRSPR